MNNSKVALLDIWFISSIFLALLGLQNNDGSSLSNDIFQQRDKKSRSSSMRLFQFSAVFFLYRRGRHCVSFNGFKFTIQAYN